MDAKEQLLQARRALQAAVDNALETLPEWRALQSVEEAIEALERSRKLKSPPSGLHHGITDAQPPQSYARLAIDAVREAGEPLTTPQIIEYIGRFRVLPSDPERAKINIASALSKEEDLHSIGWKGGRAWWLSGEKVPSPKLDFSTP